MKQKRNYHYFYYWFPVLLYCIVIFIQSEYAHSFEVRKLPHIDKLFHFLGYALLGVLFIRGFNNSRFRNDYKCILIASILLTGLFGISDEFHQQYTPYRNADIWDALVDMAGGTLGVCLYGILSTKYPGISRI